MIVANCALRAGLRVGTDGLGQYKTPGMPGFLRAQRGRARSALLWRVRLIINSNNMKEKLLLAPNQIQVVCHILTGPCQLTERGDVAVAIAMTSQAGVLTELQFKFRATCKVKSREGLHN